MYFEIWSIPGGSILDDFATQDEALDFVRYLLEGVPAKEADDLYLTVVRDDGTGETIATGQALATLAKRGAIRAST